MATEPKITFKPVGNRIVVEPLEEESDMSSGGIYIPDTAKERPQSGKVIAVGPGKLTEDGKRLPVEVCVGDIVVYSKYGGTEYKDGDIEYWCSATTTSCSPGRVPAATVHRSTHKHSGGLKCQSS